MVGRRPSALAALAVVALRVRLRGGPGDLRLRPPRRSTAGGHDGVAQCVRLSQWPAAQRPDVHQVLPRRVQELPRQAVLVVPRARSGHRPALLAELGLQSGLPSLESGGARLHDPFNARRPAARRRLRLRQDVPRLPPDEHRFQRPRRQPPPQRADNSPAHVPGLPQRRRRRRQGHARWQLVHVVPHRHEPPSGAGDLQQLPPGQDLRYARLPEVSRRRGAQHQAATAGLLRLSRHRVQAACRQGRVPHLPHGHRRLPPRAVHYRDPEELPVLPRQETRRQERPPEQMRHLPQGHRSRGRPPRRSTPRPSRRATCARPVIRTSCTPSALGSGITSCRTVPQGQVPRGSEDAEQLGVHQLPRPARPGTPTASAVACVTAAPIHTARPSVPKIRG